MNRLPPRAFTETKLFVILLGALTALDPLTIDMYLPAFGAIQRDFATSIARVELSVTTFFVGMAFGQLFYGPLADRFGRRRPLLAGMLVYLAATVGCALSPNVGVFIAFRLLQALGGCAGMVITRAIVRDLFDKTRAAVFLSNLALVMGLAPIAAPSIGGFVSHALGWRAIFGLLAGANIACMLCIYRLLPETRPPVAGASRPRLGASLRAYAGLLRNREFVGYLIPDAAIRAGMFAYIAGSPFVFIQLYAIPAERYGLVFGANGLGLMAASQLNRRLLRHRSPEAILRSSVKAAALTSILVFLGTWLGFPAWLMLVAIFGFLVTLNFVGPNSLAGALSTQGHQAGTASALYGCLQWSLASVSSLCVAALHNGTAYPMTGVILGCGVVSLAAFTALVDPKRPIRQQRPPVLLTDAQARG